MEYYEKKNFFTLVSKKSMIQLFETFFWLCIALKKTNKLFSTSTWCSELVQEHVAQCKIFRETTVQQFVKGCELQSLNLKVTNSKYATAAVVQKLSTLQ